MGRARSGIERNKLKMKRLFAAALLLAVGLVDNQAEARWLDAHDTTATVDTTSATDTSVTVDPVADSPVDPAVETAIQD